MKLTFFNVFNFITFRNHPVTPERTRVQAPHLEVTHFTSLSSGWAVLLQLAAGASRACDNYGGH